MRTQIQKMQKRILLVSYVHEGRVQAGQYLLDPAEVDVPDRVIHRPLVPMKLDESTVLEQGDFHPFRGGIDDQFLAHARIGSVPGSP